LQAVKAAGWLELPERLDQRAIDREVLVREQRLDLRLAEHRLEELGRERAVEQPVAVPTGPALPARGQAWCTP